MDKRTEETPLWRVARKEQWSPTRIRQVAGIVAPPIPMGRIATALGVQVCTHLDYNNLPCFEICGNQTMLGLGPRPASERFAIARALAYLLIAGDEMLVDALYYFSSIDFFQPEAPMLANQFALQVLVPLKQLAAMGPTTQINLAARAKQFGVAKTHLWAAARGIERGGWEVYDDDDDAAAAAPKRYGYLRKV